MSKKNKVFEALSEFDRANATPAHADNSGTTAAQSETVEQTSAAIVNANAATETQQRTFEGMTAAPAPRKAKENKSKHVNILLRPSLVSAIKTLAERDGESVNELYNQAVEMLVRTRGIAI